MITKAQITRQASEDNVPAKTVERDYVLAHVVAAIATLESPKLIFKGGTALRLCHFQDFRYSADLDFSVLDASADEARAIIEELLPKVTGSIESVHLTSATPPRIAYTGILGKQRTIKLDLADDELVLETERKELLPRWSDVPNCPPVYAYTPLETVAEKLRCVLQRLQCRDLLDLCTLFQDSSVKPADAARVFRQKAEHRGLDPAIFPARYSERIPRYAKRWESELREHVPGDLPHFDDIERRMGRFLRKAGLL